MTDVNSVPSMFDVIKNCEPVNAGLANPYKYSEATKQHCGADMAIMKSDHICFSYLEESIEVVREKFTPEEVQFQLEFSYNLFVKYRQFKADFKLDSYYHTVRDIEHNMDLMIMGEAVDNFTIKSAYIQTIANLDNLLHRLCYHQATLQKILIEYTI